MTVAKRDENQALFTREEDRCHRDCTKNLTESINC